MYIDEQYEEICSVVRLFKADGVEEVMATNMRVVLRCQSMYIANNLVANLSNAGFVHNRVEKGLKTDFYYVETSLD